ncbi:beta-ketoacyl synthase N-terminal-like domain-containing protein [Streptomyces bohaiensis]|uniref:polyketide synthase n=1 Tax=Streptomyces bohaiensis TaxID=1431344 RepID=UPI003B81D3CB
MNDYIDQLDGLTRKQLMVLLARRHQESTQGIAVSGMGCRFPGGIDTPDALWEAVRGARAVRAAGSQPPTDSSGRPRWDTTAPDLAPLAPTLAAGAYLDDVDLFDADRFDLTPEEAEHLDPQQRLLLEVTLQALADANLTLRALRRRRVGVYVGISTAEYNFAGLRNGIGKDDLSPYMGTGTALSAASGRIALALGVRGPALTLDTACSSALTAVHLAAGALRAEECDIAVVGVSHLLLSPFTSEVFAQAGMVSPTGRCLPFTAEADGYVRAEGCGVLVLERYRDAAADGRQPYAVVRGSAVHQDGDREQLAAWSAASQRTVVDLALRRTGAAAHDVRYVEAQANGSRVGGVVEAETLAAAYDRRGAAAPELYVGSAKANLGYLETASGVAGMMKTALALAHREIPPQPGADRPDPAIAWERTGLRLATAPRPWPTTARTLAGVSATGFTGTAAHVVMEATPLPGSAPPERGGPALLLLSAHTPASLSATAERLRAHLLARGGWSRGAVCRTLAERRDHLAHRHAAVVHSDEELLAALDRAATAGPLVRALPASSGVLLDLRRGAPQAGLGSSGARRPEPGRAPGEDAGDPTPAWLDRVRAAGAPIAGVVCAAAVAAPCLAALTRDGASAWERSDDGDTVTLRRADAGEVPLTDPAAFDEADWYGLLAAAYLAGGDVDPGALTPDDPPPLMRLPGPALLGSRYWTDVNIWR